VLEDIAEALADVQSGHQTFLDTLQVIVEFVFLFECCCTHHFNIRIRVSLISPQFQLALSPSLVDPIAAMSSAFMTVATLGNAYATLIKSFPSLVNNLKSQDSRKKLGLVAKVEILHSFFCIIFCIACV